MSSPFIFPPLFAPSLFFAPVRYHSLSLLLSPSITNPSYHPVSLTPFITQHHQPLLSPSITNPFYHPASPTPLITQHHQPVLSPIITNPSYHPTSPTPLITQHHQPFHQPTKSSTHPPTHDLSSFLLHYLPQSVLK